MSQARGLVKGRSILEEHMRSRYVFEERVRYARTSKPNLACDLAVSIARGVKDESPVTVDHN